MGFSIGKYLGLDCWQKGLSQNFRDQNTPVHHNGYHFESDYLDPFSAEKCGIRQRTSKSAAEFDNASEFSEFDNNRKLTNSTELSNSASIIGYQIRHRHINVTNYLFTLC